MAEPETDLRPMCGLVMPISTIDGCSEAHWSDVHQILSDSAEDAGFKPALVSNGDETGIIQKRIIQNLYDNPIVVCDVSGKNPNVMFELGLRLAFDKPTIIVKDDKTAYSFDTSPIEHLVYPRDLRFSRIVEFKEKLTEKIQATHKRATEDASYTTFLKNFGEFTVAKLEKKEVSGQEYILEEIRAIRQELSAKPSSTNTAIRFGPNNANSEVFDSDINLCLNGKSPEEIDELMGLALTNPTVKSAAIKRFAGHRHLVLDLSEADVKPIEIAKSLGLGDRLRDSKLHKRFNKQPRQRST